MKKIITLTSLIFCALISMAQAPDDYYSSADGKSGKALKTALFKIISGHKNLGYDNLWSAYKQTDLRKDGKIWDMYSNTTNYDPDKGHSGNYSKEGDMFNREHSFPKSWFSEASPMKADVFHVVPTDGYVNNRRSNYPYGETTNPKYESNNGFSKVGPCSLAGYSGTVFEPADEFKGDFARIYFYMATCYEDKIANWSSDMLSNNSYPAYTDWAINMLLKWAFEDPVSQKEIDRNNAAYKLQGNRNPFVDFPRLEQYVWGGSKDASFSCDNYQQPTTFAYYSDKNTHGDVDGQTPPVDPIVPDPPVDPIAPGEIPVGPYTFTLVTNIANLTSGDYYVIATEKYGKALGALEGEICSAVNVAIDGMSFNTSVNSDESPYTFTISEQGNYYTLYYNKEKGYLQQTGKKKLGVTQDVADAALWDITISSDGTASIVNKANSSYKLEYNSSAPRFTCYNSGQQPVQIYKADVPTAMPGVIAGKSAKSNDVYSVTGKLVRKNATSLTGLPSGLYIIDNRKVVVK